MATKPRSTVKNAGSTTGATSKRIGKAAGAAAAKAKGAPSGAPLALKSRTKTPRTQNTAGEAAPGKAFTPTQRQSLLRVGLKALGDVRDGVVHRQTHVVESLLGLAPPAGAKRARASTPRTPLDTLGDSLGFRKLEDVFDQRIAGALARLGAPSAQEFDALRTEVQSLRKALAATQALRPKRGSAAND